MIIGSYNGTPIVGLPDIDGTGHPHTFLSSLELGMSHATSTVLSPFTGQMQTQQWPGADSWYGTAELPPMTPAQAGAWEGFIYNLRGVQFPFLIGDPSRITPHGTGNAQAGGPQVNMEGIFPANSNYVMAQILYTKNWVANQSNLLMPGDYIQVGYRLHMVLDGVDQLNVHSDANGIASMTIAPSLRDLPTDGQPVIIHNAVGMFRLQSNKISVLKNHDGTQHLSFPVIEYR